MPSSSAPSASEGEAGQSEAVTPAGQSDSAQTGRVSSVTRHAPRDRCHSMPVE